MKLSEYERLDRKWRRVERDANMTHRYAMFGSFDADTQPPRWDSRIFVSEGGWTSRWMVTKELRVALQRWGLRSIGTALPEAVTDGGGYQCGGCRYFAALDSDYGLCCNVNSVNDGRVVFEHGGCEHPSMLEKEAHDARTEATAP